MDMQQNSQLTLERKIHTRARTHARLQCAIHTNEKTTTTNGTHIKTHMFNHAGAHVHKQDGRKQKLFIFHMYAAAELAISLYGKYESSPQSAAMFQFQVLTGHVVQCLFYKCRILCCNATVLGAKLTKYGEFPFVVHRYFGSVRSSHVMGSND